MKKNAMRKNLTQSILKSLGRYIAIVAIIALGSSIFVGLRMTKTDMVATGQKYMDEQNMFDLRLVSSYGWGADQLAKIQSMEGLAEAEGIVSVDAIASVPGIKDDAVFRFYAIPESLNRIVLTGGRMPVSANECLIDGYFATEDMLGSTVTISQGNDDATMDYFGEKTFTVVGFVSTPLYMDMNRGTTSVGNGILETYLFLPRQSLNADFYTEIHATIPGDFAVYTDSYNDAMERETRRFEELLKPLADQRYRQVREDAIQSYYDGLAEYFEGRMEFNKAKEEVSGELAEAYQKLTDAQAELTDAERQIADGQRQIAAGKQKLVDGQKELDEGRKQLEETKAQLSAPMDQMLETMQSGKGNLMRRIAEYDIQIQQINDDLAQLEHVTGPVDAQIAELNLKIMDLGVQISICDTTIEATRGALDAANLLPKLNASLIASLQERINQEQIKKADAIARRDALIAQRDALEQQPTGEYRKKLELEAKKAAVQAEKGAWVSMLSTLEKSISDLQAAKKLLNDQFASAEAELAAGQQQINSGWATIQEKEKELEDAIQKVAEGKAELEDGWLEYEEGKAEAERELAEAEQELADGKAKLDDARKQIQQMKELSLYVLDRNSNIGYGSLDSASDIVQGVSRVIPAFFLLVASLVCITTMTRMIDEERTQIGTLKALGYSNSAIISKYLIYAGSGAILGCGLGVTVGSIFFPKVLWQAYKIMLYLPDDIILKFNWPLCLTVVLSYAAVILLVTWYCCRKALEEQPAELIRPKAPEAGKQLLIEKLPVWNRVSFLNKVTIRNIFRYRQRLAMMMVGIGGCTALLLTGFGLRDSIVNVVNYQFQDVTVYDLQVYFENGLTPDDQADFLNEVKASAENVLFYHQQSVDLEFGGKTRSIYLMAGEEKICEFIDFHVGNRQVDVPELHEVLVSVGAAEAMGIEIGDTIHVRNPDMLTLELTVSGIYDNHIYNYLIVHPNTIADQWGAAPELQMALVQVRDGQDVYGVSADISKLRSVMNVSVSDDLANMVGNMLTALDSVIWVIVLCAGALAVVVLYNLTNININERIREIATIKVLGFNAAETAAYVFKENLTLTLVGSGLGLGLGYMMLLFVMSQIKIDMVWFKALTMPLSYVLSFVLTVASACVVNFIFYFRLDKINMAEALKSVE